jgi:hypothetical protein
VGNIFGFALDENCISVEDITSLTSRVWCLSMYTGDLILDGYIVKCVSFGNVSL